ncbi:MAG TPA: acyl-CoA reductase [Bacteroidales bacterium]|nr:acyl-CoA reductase [Bacteroidales bacterium]HRT90273.1 acyl-CoA reductase [Bacteroidales bacterium]
MKPEEITKGLAALGDILRDSASGRKGRYSSLIDSVIARQQTVNPWFTPENVRLALDAVASNLETEKLEEWVSRYPLIKQKREPLTIGIIMAGNIPLVGFHDLLSVLVTGNKALVKTSSKDPELPVFIAGLLTDINSGFRDMIYFSEGPLKGFDAVIATGSNNTSRYFEYYFGKYPNLIRKNRNSIAVISGTETPEELQRTGDDIFSYFGLGCRNVSKLYLPEGYDTGLLKKAWEKYSGLVNHTKYANNYDYYKAVYLVNRENFEDFGFCMLKEERALASPVAVVHYEYYRRDEDFEQMIGPDMDKIQCITGKGLLDFGKTQWPRLDDYADGRDTVDFILKIKP